MVDGHTDARTLHQKRHQIVLAYRANKHGPTTAMLARQQSNVRDITHTLAATSRNTAYVRSTRDNNTTRQLIGRTGQRVCMHICMCTHTIARARTTFVARSHRQLNWVDQLASHVAASVLVRGNHKYVYPRCAHEVWVRCDSVCSSRLATCMASYSQRASRSRPHTAEARGSMRSSRKGEEFGTPL